MSVYEPKASRVALVSAFAAIYIIWGSTYLGIRFAVETLPPFLMAGARFLLAGALLYGWAVACGAEWPDRRAWVTAAIIGALLLVGGNGLVTWAEQTVTSSVAALLLASVPLWVVLMDWLRPRGTRPNVTSVLGILAGFAGVALLIGPGLLAGTGQINPWGAAAILLAAVSWAAGSLYARDAPTVKSGAQMSAMQMLTGGLFLLAAALVNGELADFSLNSVSLRSALAFGYLTLFGSVVAFSAYGWIVQRTSATLASTYAYVNPVVAVALGWALANEPVTARTLIAAAIIVGAVALITVKRSEPSPAPDISQPNPTELARRPERASIEHDRESISQIGHGHVEKHIRPDIT